MGHAQRPKRPAPLHRPALALALCLNLGGCIVPVPERGDPLDFEFMTPDALREYSEQVFRRHNRVVSQLMMRGGAATDSSIERAERRMNRACASLNRIASMRARGEDPDLGLQDRVRRDIRHCEHQTARVAELLDQQATATDSFLDPDPDRRPRNR